MDIRLKLKKLSSYTKKVGYFFILTPIFEFIAKFFNLKTPSEILFNHYHLDGIGLYFGVIYTLSFFLLYIHSQIEYVIKEIDINIANEVRELKKNEELKNKFSRLK